MPLNPDLGIEVDTKQGRLIISSDDTTMLAKAELLLGVLNARQFKDDPDQIESLIDRFIPEINSPDLDDLYRAQGNAQARAEVIGEFGLLDSREVHRLTGGTAANMAAKASRLKAAGRLFTVTHEGKKLYPGFQFGADGQPKPAMARVLEVMKPWAGHGWQIAVWFITPNGWLDRQRPVDLLDTDPEVIVAAARRDIEVAF